jgi:cellulose synthase/poly-beta-1,6-N-acetylglucosamine synthase-like glycosyltransferase
VIPSPSSHTRRFAILIPAHNEEHTLAPTLESVFKIDYPREWFDVVVIADNCSDATAEVAGNLGARVLQRSNTELRGKGYALRWGFDHLMESRPEYEAFVVVDADSVLSENFLVIMNHYLDDGARVVQAGDMVAPQTGVWSSEITRLGFTLYNLVRPLGRRALGFTAGLRGNGMCFTRSVLQGFPWRSYSRAEDLEYGVHLVLNDIVVVLAPEATVLATMPRNPKLAESQRARWEGGRLPIIRAFALPLLRKAVLGHSPRALDMLIELLTPALVNLMVAITFMAMLTTVLSLMGIEAMTTFAAWWLALFVMGFLHMFVGLIAARADANLYKALLYLPRYVIWKILLYLRLARRSRSDEWVRTGREPARSG